MPTYMQQMLRGQAVQVSAKQGSSEVDTVLTYTGQEVQSILDKANAAPIDTVATGSSAGLMSKQDKQKLDDIQEASVADVIDICT